MLRWQGFYPLYDDVRTGAATLIPQVSKMNGCCCSKIDVPQVDGLFLVCMAEALAETSIKQRV